jgi:hypothetical protein
MGCLYIGGGRCVFCLFMLIKCSILDVIYIYR